MDKRREELQRQVQRVVGEISIRQEEVHQLQYLCKNEQDPNKQEVMKEVIQQNQKRMAELLQEKNELWWTLTHPNEQEAAPKQTAQH